MQTIYLDEDDDIISICDRLDWLAAAQALLVLPGSGGVLREGLDLVRLRRYADRVRLEVGIVTADPDITRQAQALGLPAFATVPLGQQSRRGWWRGRQRRERVGLPTVGGDRLRPHPLASPLDEGDRKEIQQRLTPASRRRIWLWRYAAVLLFFVVVALLVVAFAYLIPAATLTLKPQVIPLRVRQAIRVDPALARIDYSQSAVPGRLLAVTQSWQTDVETTGIVSVPNAPARGQVVFVNRLAQAVVVPAGTRVSTSEGTNILFQVTEAVTLAGVVGSTAEAEVIAVAAGPQGNVAANLINRVAGAPALQVDVRNLEEMTGGGVRETTAVTEADRDRLRAQVLQFLQAVALSEMETQLTEREFLARDSIQVVTILHETYSHAVGDQTNRLALEIRAELAGTAVNTTEAAGLVFDALARQVPDDFALVPSSIKFESDQVLNVDDQGRVTFAMIGEALAAAELELSAPLAAITGQEPGIAIAYLYEQLPLREPPHVAIRPIWFGRLPYLATRIQTTVQAEESGR